MQVFKTKGKLPDQLADVPPIPSGMEYIWEFHKEVFTGEPLTYMEMEAWARMTGKQLTPWEVKAIKALDRVFWQVQRG